jgi:hypothetical protein
MTAKHDLNDDGVVVVIGSGAEEERSPTSFAKKASRSFAWKRELT